MSTVSHPPHSRISGEPVWGLAELFPAQGCWHERDYLDLDTNRRIEFTDGYIEVQPMPTTLHQFVLRYLNAIMCRFVDAHQLGELIFGGVRVRVRPSRYREPDMVFMGKEHVDRIGNQFWEGADLVVEIVSPDDESQRRDYESKVLDYAEGGIPEYWIVDPQQSRIRVLTLSGSGYRLHGDFVRGQQATSLVLTGFLADVSATFDAGRLPSEQSSSSAGISRDS